jgi:hypothetical protein
MPQTTFGEVVGLDPVMPIAPHPNDIVDCEDSGSQMRRADCLEAADGTFWEDEHGRAVHEEQLVREYLDGVIEWSDEYNASSENVDQYGYLIYENPQCYRESIKEALEDALYGCDDLDFLTDDAIDTVFEALEDKMVGKSTSGYSSPSGIDVTFNSFDWGEVEEQVDINEIDLLSALHKRDDLEEILDSLDNEFCLYRYVRSVYDDDGKFVGHERGEIIQSGCNGEYPSFTLTNNTGLWYYYGCTSEDLESAWNEYAEENGLPKID